MPLEPIKSFRSPLCMLLASLPTFSASVTILAWPCLRTWLSCANLSTAACNSLICSSIPKVQCHALGGQSDLDYSSSAQYV